MTGSCGHVIKSDQIGLADQVFEVKQFSKQTNKQKTHDQHKHTEEKGKQTNKLKETIQQTNHPTFLPKFPNTYLWNILYGSPTKKNMFVSKVLVPFLFSIADANFV